MALKPRCSQGYGEIRTSYVPQVYYLQQVAVSRAETILSTRRSGDTDEI